MNHDGSGKTETQNFSKNSCSERSYLEELCDLLGRESHGAALRELLDRERQCLFQWAQSHHILFLEEEIRQRVETLRQLPGGNEHVVYYDSSLNRVIKITCPPAFGARSSAYQYLLNLIRCNEYLGDDFKVEGVIKKFRTEDNASGNAIIISQPFILWVEKPRSQKSTHTWTSLAS